ncbi:MAG TPA: hypothetical protein VN641_06510 [Urbifossiella sp.]|jgi:hypothetical protein|nr:hypothetical protein [Urbifossiella sp.]
MTDPVNLDAKELPIPSGMLPEVGDAIREWVLSVVDSRVRQTLPQITAGVKAGMDRTYAGIARQMDQITRLLVELLAERRAGEEWRNGPTNEGEE